MNFYHLQATSCTPQVNLYVKDVEVSEVSILKMLVLVRCIGRRHRMDIRYPSDVELKLDQFILGLASNSFASNMNNLNLGTGIGQPRGGWTGCLD